MTRIEVIPYSSLDQQLDLALSLRSLKKKKQIKNHHDLGNCFMVELFSLDTCTRY